MEWIKFDAIAEIVRKAVPSNAKKERPMSSWTKNNRCKYIELRIDMRTGACLLYDRDGQTIDMDVLRKQHT